MYEVAKFRVKAPSDATIIVRGFTLKDYSGNVVDVERYVSKVNVTIDGKDVDGLKWNVNKDRELVISFKDAEIEPKHDATIAVSMSFNEEFDTFGSMQYEIKNADVANDLTYFSAIDKKTETRVSQDTTKSLQSTHGQWTIYTFK
jgi:hypothetical protein